VKDNRYDGIRASNNGKSIFVGDYVPGGSMELKDITATGNGDDGIEIAGSDIDVIDAVATDNLRYGIYIVSSKKIDVKNAKANDNYSDGICILDSTDISLIDTVATDNDSDGIEIILSKKIDIENFEGNNNGGSGILIFSTEDLELSLKGSISLNENRYEGLHTVFSRGSIILFGDLEANDNGRLGIDLALSSKVTFYIDDGASLSACGNKFNTDISITSASTLILEVGGTCTGLILILGGGSIPCNACPPTPLI
jgi:parallel beta-helix repeat protein